MAPLPYNPESTNKGLGGQKTQRSLVGDDDLKPAQQLPSVISIACASNACQPAMDMGLQQRRAGAHDLSAFASHVARCTDGLQTPLGWWQIRTLRQSALSCGLSSAIEVEDDPSVPLPIEHPSHPFGRPGTSERILEEHSAERFHTGFIQCGEKAVSARNDEGVRSVLA